MIISWRTYIILNANDSRAIPSSGFMVNKRHKNITSTFSMLQNAFIGNVAINIHGVRYAYV
jgi:hypothetical protein